MMSTAKDFLNYNHRNIWLWAKLKPVKVYNDLGSRTTAWILSISVILRYISSTSKLTRLLYNTVSIKMSKLFSILFTTNYSQIILIEACLATINAMYTTGNVAILYIDCILFSVYINKFEWILLQRSIFVGITSRMTGGF